MSTLNAVEIAIDEQGALMFVYDDALTALLDAGDAHIARASHVEPCAGNTWHADMSPVGGPVLGPFALRQEALDAERRWLSANVIST